LRASDLQCGAAVADVGQMAGEVVSRHVPCESTTGQQRRLGAITKTASGHARRLLVEAG
jgi:hypothetical protein